MGSKHFIGIDVGSGSVRAGLFNTDGKLKKVAVKDILVNNPEAGFYEQSSEDIWDAVCYTVQEITKGEDIESIGGISFCATCSLVAVGAHGQPVSISKNGDPRFNIVMWMDHRAKVEADFINSTKHPVLNYVGNSISLEMETPKLLWLKKNLPESFKATQQYFDLGDFLRWKATGSLKRSICCTVCKWTFVNEKENCGWDHSYFETIGLSDALEKIGHQFSFPGDSNVISKEAAKMLKLNPNTEVGFSMIDAHAGVLGMIGCHEEGELPTPVSQRLAMIAGTSTCHMAMSRSSFNIPGVWGPYYGVILSSYYLSEGGQSAAGKLLDHVVMSHVAYHPMLTELGSHGNVLSKLEEILKRLESNNPDASLTILTKDLHIWPDFHGNRSPIADSNLKGMISGLTLSTSEEDLAVIYLATIQALAYGSRQIKNAMESAGHKFTELLICGGLTKSKLYLQTHADSIGLPVIVPDCKEPVLLGSAISAAAAYFGSDADDMNQDSTSLTDIVAKMAGTCKRIDPDLKTMECHDKKYKVFMKMLEHQRLYNELIE